MSENNASVIAKYTKGGSAAVQVLRQIAADTSGTLAKYTKAPDDEDPPDSLGGLRPSITADQALPPSAPPSWAQRQWRDFRDQTIGGVGKDLSRAGSWAVDLPANVLSSTIGNFTGGVEAMQQGGREIRAGQVLPQFPSSDPRTWTPGGLLRAGGGVMGAAFAPVTAATENLVEEPVTELSGSPEIGRRAGLVVNALTASPRLLGVVNRARPGAQATRSVAETVQAAPQSSDVLQRLRDNPRLTLADVDPTLRQRAMGIAVEPGPAKNLLFDRVRERAASAPNAVREAYDTAMGPAPNVIETLQRYRQTAQENAREGFGAAFANARPVDVSPVLKAIDDKIAPGVNALATPGTTVARGPIQDRLAELRGMLTDGKSVVTDPQRLHEIQSELGREVRDLTTSATGSDRRLGRELANVQDKLVTQIDAATEGRYRPARQQYRSDMEIHDAFDRGTEILQNRATKAGLREDTPDAWRAWVTEASPEEMKAAQLGARAMVEQRIGGLRNAARQGMALPDSEFNLQKFQMLFGMNEATRLGRLLRDERDIAETNAKLFANSATAERLAGHEAVKVRNPNPLSYGSFLPATLAEIVGMGAGFPELGHAAAVGTGALSAARFAQNRIGRRMDMARNLREAEMLLATGGQREQAIDRLVREMNRPQNPLALPLTYVPQENRR